MAVPFGFSVGDFIAVISLTIKICEALGDSSNALKEFHNARQELKDFNNVIEQLQKSVFDGTPISEQNIARVKEVLDGCKQALGEFHDFLVSYKGVQSVRRRVSFILWGKEKLEPFRSRIQRNIALLGLIQQELNR